MIDALKNTTLEEANDEFVSLIFDKTKRLNIRVYCEKHLEDKKDREASIDVNTWFYNDPETFPTPPTKVEIKDIKEFQENQGLYPSRFK
jgi:hypothetical protein